MIKYLLTIIFLVVCNSLIACSCYGHVNIIHVNSHDVWLKGIVVSNSTHNNELKKFKVEIIEIYKGKISSNIIEIFTRINDSNCGVHYEVSNEPIYLFLHKTENSYTTNLCSNNFYEKEIDEFYETLLKDFLKGEKVIWKNSQGQINAKGQLKNNFPIGKWEEYDFNFLELKRKGKYKKGKRNGVWKTYDFSSGDLIKKTKYKNGLEKIKK